MGMFYCPTRQVRCVSFEALEFLLTCAERGGVHLPDFTVITPVFDDQGTDIIFWAASRRHHADVGGILPGSWLSALL